MVGPHMYREIMFIAICTMLPCRSAGVSKRQYCPSVMSGLYLAPMITRIRISSVAFRSISTRNTATVTPMMIHVT